MRYDVNAYKCPHLHSMYDVMNIMMWCMTQVYNQYVLLLPHNYALHREACNEQQGIDFS